MSMAYLDNTNGLWELPARVPLPPDRVSLISILSRKLSTFPIVIDNANKQEVSLSEEELHSTFLPLYFAIKEKERLARAEGRRCLVGIIGPPGAGKSTFAETFRQVWDAAGDGSDESKCVVLGGDAYHRYNQELKATPLVLPDGKVDSLMSIKGAPETMDLDLFLRDLHRLRDDTTAAEVRLPVYDRRLHDPVAAAVAVAAAQRTVLIEGLYLLHAADGWDRVGPLLDLTLYLHAPPHLSRARVVDRKVRNGKDRGTVEDHFDRVDVRSIHIVEACRDRADVQITFRSAAGDPPAAGDSAGEPGAAATAAAAAAAAATSAAAAGGRFVPAEGGVVVRGRGGRAAHLLAVGLNPAFQKTLSLASLAVGGVNRAESLTYSCGGKGQHLATAAARLSAGSAAVAHFLGEAGEPGRYIEKILAGRGVAQLTEWIPGAATRTATTLLETSTGRMTEVIDPSDPVPAGPVTSLLRRIRAWVADGAGPSGADGGGGGGGGGGDAPRRGVALCGTWPPGVGEDFYASVALSLTPDITLLLDGYKGVGPTLATGRVDVLKINSDELLLLMGLPAGGDIDAAARGCLRAHLRPGALLAVTRGPRPALLYRAGRPPAPAAGAGGDGGGEGECKWEVTVPAVTARNPIGAGDTCGGAMLYALTAGHEGPAALAWGLACASASCLHLEGAFYTCEDAVALHRQVKITSAPF